MDTLFPIIIVIAISEIIISGTWRPFYFTVGIPIYKRTLSLSSKPNLSQDKLTHHFEESIFNPLIFRQISDDQVAFRESLFSFRLTYTPLMHGLIRHDRGKLEIVGLANWFTLVLIPFFIANVTALEGQRKLVVSFTIFPIGILSLLYFIQVKRFNKVYEILSDQNNDNAREL